MNKLYLLAQQKRLAVLLCARCVDIMYYQYGILTANDLNFQLFDLIA